MMNCLTLMIHFHIPYLTHLTPFVEERMDSLEASLGALKSACEEERTLLADLRSLDEEIARLTGVVSSLVHLSMQSLTCPPAAS